MNDFFEQSIIYDIYGNLLNENQKNVYEYHIIDDLSFNEIGEELNLTRQAAYDLFKRANKKLYEFENKLGLYKRMKDIEHIANDIKNISKDNNQILSLTDKIIKITKMEEKYGSKNKIKKTRTCS